MGIQASRLLSGDCVWEDVLWLWSRAGMTAVLHEILGDLGSFKLHALPSEEWGL